MKKAIIILFIVFISISLFGQQKQPKVKEMFEKAYIYKESSLLISESEFNCAFMITDKIKEDIKIIGAKQGWVQREYYTDGNVMYINKGSKDGLKEGDIFWVLEKGASISHPFEGKSLGTYYLRKGLAVLTCIYEDKACVTLESGCVPVHIGNFLLKYKPQKEVIEKPIDYLNCRLIKSDINGQVVYFKRDNMMENRSIVADNYMVAVDIGNAYLKTGDFLLFYREIQKNLPPMIMGTGIVVSAQKTNSTVKVLKVSNPIQIGDHVTHLPLYRKAVFEGKEKLPQLDPKKKVVQIEEGDKVLELNILFNLSDSKVDAQGAGEIEKIREFIKDKQQFTIILKGFSCNIGRVEYNLKLAKDRVESVKKYLVDKLAIEPGLVESYFYGEKNCEFDNSSEASRRKNRRVLITVVGR